MKIPSHRRIQRGDRESEPRPHEKSPVPVGFLRNTGTDPPSTQPFGFVSVVVDFLFIVTPIVGVCNCSMFCYALLCVHSSFANVLMGKGKLVALLILSYLCLVVVVWLFLAM